MEHSLGHRGGRTCCISRRCGGCWRRKESGKGLGGDSLIATFKFVAFRSQIAIAVRLTDAAEAFVSSSTHYQLAANYMNIAAGGTFVGSIVTIPMAVITTDKLSSSLATGLVFVFLIGSFSLHGIAQVFQAQVKP